MTFRIKRKLRAHQLKQLNARNKHLVDRMFFPSKRAARKSILFTGATFTSEMDGKKVEVKVPKRKMTRGAYFDLVSGMWGRKYTNRQERAIDEIGRVMESRHGKAIGSRQEELLHLRTSRRDESETDGNPRFRKAGRSSQDRRKYLQSELENLNGRDAQDIVQHTMELRRKRAAKLLEYRGSKQYKRKLAEIKEELEKGAKK